MKKGFGYVSNKIWEKYKRIISTFLDRDAAKQSILWAHHPSQLMPFGEDSYPGYYIRPIEALCYYNAFRNWPINRETTNGELDEENLSIIISKSYIESKGYLNNEGYFDFDWSLDRFVINGIVYKPSGDTQIAQAKDEALAFLIILKRDRDTTLSNIIDDSDLPDNVVFDSHGQPVFDSNGNYIYIGIE